MVQKTNTKVYADPADKRPRFQVTADDRRFNAGHGLPLAERDYTVKSWRACRPQRAQLHCFKVKCAERRSRRVTGREVRTPAAQLYPSNPQRTASASSHTTPARQRPQNTAAEPKSLMRRMSLCCSRVTWSASFSMAVLRNSIASTASKAPIMPAYQAPLGATRRPSGKPITTRRASSRSAGSVLKPSASPRSECWVAL